MYAALRFFVTKRPVTFGICLAALGFSLFFGVKFLLGALWMNDPAHRNQALEAWMRPRYVAMSYHLPPQVLGEALGIGPPPKGRAKEPLTMADIAAAQGVSLEELTARVSAAASAFHQGDGR